MGTTSEDIDNDGIDLLLKMNYGIMYRCIFKDNSKCFFDCFRGCFSSSIEEITAFAV